MRSFFIHIRRPAIRTVTLLSCSSAREAMSARFDQEPARTSDEAIDAHLDACSKCREFDSRLANLARPLRIRPTTTVPPTLLPLLRGARATGNTVDTSRRWRPRFELPRVAGWAMAAVPAALAIVALAQLGVGHVTHYPPALTPTRCTSYFLVHHVWPGY